MRRIGLTSVILLALTCKNPEERARESLRANLQLALERGNDALGRGDFEEAVQHFKFVTLQASQDPVGFMLLAKAQRGAGNDVAALLTLNQAEELAGASDPNIRREQADIYRHRKQWKKAIAVMTELRDSNQLTDTELLTLARWLSAHGDKADAFRTLELVQRKKPDDLNAKIVEAELLLAKGDDKLSANLMDRLVKENPTLARPRILRAKYFLNHGFPEYAARDLEQIRSDPSSEDAQEALVVKIKALHAQRNYQQAFEELIIQNKKNPSDPDILAMLAETELLKGRYNEAHQWIDQALAQRADSAHSIYLRGQVYEAQEDPKRAIESYRDALKVDGRYAQAMSKLWRLVQKNDAMEARRLLEKLYEMGEASADEQIALATEYASSGINRELALKILQKQLLLSPNSSALKDLKKKLQRGQKRGGGVVIMR